MSNQKQTQTDILRKELFDLQAKRKQTEDELAMHRIVLENNKVGMNDPLVDKEDFPRNDIDVYAVRLARSNIVKLENDAKETFLQIQAKLEELHSISSS